MKSSPLWMSMVLVVLAFGAGWVLRGGEHPEETTDDARVTDWTCSMHPHVHLPSPGQCPLCGMDLIPATRQKPTPGADVLNLTLSENALALADIGTVEVLPLEGRVEQDIHLTGRLATDPTRIQVISPRVEGRIQRLDVARPWQSVVAGQVVAGIYSPMFLQAQRDYLTARGMLITVPGPESQATVDVALARLVTMGAGPAQLALLESTGQVLELLDVVSPGSGLVMEQMVKPGDTISMGMPLVGLVDVSRLQVLLDAREQDLALLKVGQQVQFTVRGDGGKTHVGPITSIDPALDPMRRVATVRLNIPNPDGKLRPDNTVDAVVKVSVAAEEGAVLIPTSAVLLTGRRNLVYVRLPGEVPTFVARAITLGPRVGDNYVVWSGLTVGTRVVHRGTFKIDSEMQIHQLPSLLSEVDPPAPEPADIPLQTDAPAAQGARPEIPTPVTHPPPPQESAAGVEKVPAGAEAPSTAALFRVYLRIQEALARDDLAAAQAAAGDLTTTLNEVAATFKGDPREVAFRQEAEGVVRAGTSLKEGKDLAAVRIDFEVLAAALLKIGDTFGTGDLSLQWAKCPMARDGEGAYWIQGEIPLQNPYFGQRMLRCGVVVRPVGGHHE